MTTEKQDKLRIKQTDLYTLVTADNEKFMVWKEGPKDPCVRLNIGSYTEFSFV